MRKSTLKKVRKAEQDFKEKLKINLNTRSSFRRKAAHPCIRTKKEKGVPSELLLLEREGVGNRIDTELVNSQTFIINGVWPIKQLLQSLIEKPMRSFVQVILLDNQFFYWPAHLFFWG